DMVTLPRWCIRGWFARLHVRVDDDDQARFHPSSVEVLGVLGERTLGMESRRVQACGARRGTSPRRYPPTDRAARRSSLDARSPGGLTRKSSSHPAATSV